MQEEGTFVKKSSSGRSTYRVGGRLVTQARSADAREREQLLWRGSLGCVGTHDDHSVAANCFFEKKWKRKAMKSEMNG